MEPGSDLADWHALIDDELGDLEPVTNRQSGISVGHEGLLCVAVVTWQFHSTAGGPSHATNQISGSQSLNQRPGSVHLAALFVHNSVPIAARSSLSVLLVQSFLYVLLAAWLSLFIVQHGRRWGMGWVVSAVVAVAVFGGLPVVYPPGAEDPVCRGQQPAVCVPRSQLAALDDLALFSTGAVERLPSSLRPDFVLGSMPAPGPGSSVSIGSDKVVGRQQVTAMIGAEVFDPACATTEGDPAVSAGLLTWWWREQGLPEDEQIYPGGPVLAGEGAAVVEGDPGIRESVAARLTAMTDTQRRRWLAAKAEQIRTCSLTPADVT